MLVQISEPDYKIYIDSHVSDMEESFLIEIKV